MVVIVHTPVEIGSQDFNYIQACRATDFLPREWWVVSVCMCGATVDASSVDPHVIYPGVVPSILVAVSVFLRGSSAVKIES